MPNYNEIVAELQAELERVTRVRANAEKQMEKLLKAIATIQLIAEGEDRAIIEPPPLAPDEEQGFTDQVRAILKANQATPLSAVSIRDLMLTRTPKADPKVTLIHVHNTLKRLFRQDEIVEVQLADGRTGYRTKATPVIDLMASLRESLARMENSKTRELLAAEQEVVQKAIQRMMKK